MAISAFDDRPPASDQVTDYDKRHHRTYWRLLDADAEDADWREVVCVVFGVDPDENADRARTIYDTHLARARWMRETGYRQLL